MRDTFALVIEGLTDLKSLEDLPQDIIRAARIAVNDAATRGRTAMAKEVLHQVNLPRDYVSPSGKRLRVSEKATNQTLESVISARIRATSLARFAQGNATRGQRNVRVEVKHGAVRQVPGEKRLKQGYSAFLIKLRAGSESLDTKHNLGLALRVPAGQKPSRAYQPKALGNNLYLLYGPSVAQLLLPVRNARNGVAEELTPDIQRMLSDEFWRQMEI